MDRIDKNLKRKFGISSEDVDSCENDNDHDYDNDDDDDDEDDVFLNECGDFERERKAFPYKKVPRPDYQNFRSWSRNISNTPQQPSSSSSSSSSSTAVARTTLLSSKLYKITAYLGDPMQKIPW